MSPQTFIVGIALVVILVLVFFVYSAVRMSRQIARQEQAAVDRHVRLMQSYFSTIQKPGRKDARS